MAKAILARPWLAAVAELFGTMWLVFFTCLATVVFFPFPAGSLPAISLFVGLVTGVAYFGAAMMFVTLSGAHFNVCPGV